MADSISDASVSSPPHVEEISERRTYEAFFDRWPRWARVGLCALILAGLGVAAWRVYPYAAAARPKKLSSPPPINITYPGPAEFQAWLTLMGPFIGERVCHAPNGTLDLKFQGKPPAVIVAKAQMYPPRELPKVAGALAHYFRKTFPRYHTTVRLYSEESSTQPVYEVSTLEIEQRQREARAAAQHRHWPFGGARES